MKYTPEQRKEIADKHRANAIKQHESMTDDERIERALKISKQRKEWFNNISDDEWNVIIEKNRLSNQIQWENRIDKHIISNKISDKTKEQWLKRDANKRSALVRKINATKKANGTEGKSVQEDVIYELLKLIYPDIVRWHYDDRYPFNCDFYVPSNDLFIEYQGSQYHHCHRYDPNDPNDIKELERIKSNINKHDAKESQWSKIIEIWTINDPLKYTYIKNNNLNFIEFWHPWDAKHWIADKLNLKYYEVTRMYNEIEHIIKERMKQNMN